MWQACALAASLAEAASSRHRLVDDMSRRSCIAPCRRHESAALQVFLTAFSGTLTFNIPKKPIRRGALTEAARSPLSASCLLLSAFCFPSSVLCPPSSIIPTLFRGNCLNCLICLKTILAEFSRSQGNFIMKNLHLRIPWNHPFVCFLFLEGTNNSLHSPILN
jgi:hypothetical protein